MDSVINWPYLPERILLCFPERAQLTEDQRHIWLFSRLSNQSNFDPKVSYWVIRFCTEHCLRRHTPKVNLVHPQHNPHSCIRQSLLATVDLTPVGLWFFIQIHGRNPWCLRYWSAKVRWYRYLRAGLRTHQTSEARAFVHDAIFLLSSFSSGFLKLLCLDSSEVLWLLSALAVC